MRLLAGPRCRQSDAQNHVKGSIVFENPWVLNSLESKRLGFENWFGAGGIELLDITRYQHGNAPSPVGWVHKADKVSPLAIGPFANRAAFDGRAVELIFRDRPQIIPILQVGRTRDPRLT